MFTEIGRLLGMEAETAHSAGNEKDQDTDAQESAVEKLQPHDMIEDYFTENDDSLIPPLDQECSQASSAEEPREPDAPEQQKEAEKILAQNSFVHEAEVSCWSRNTSTWIMEEVVVSTATLLCCVVAALVVQWCLYYR